MLNQIVPYEDEYISSIINRFYIANGFSNYSSFISTISERTIREDFYKEHEPIETILRYMSIKDWGSFFLKHSFYAFYSPLLSDSMQISYIAGLFGLRGLKQLKQRSAVLLHCPLCDKEHPFIHRAHNLPGVKVCHKHKTPLYVNKSPITDRSTDKDIEYAIYAKEFADKMLDSSINRVNEAYTLKSKQNIMGCFKSELIDVLKMYDNPLVLSLEDNMKFEHCDYTVNFSKQNLLDLTCKKCGKRFFTTVKGFLNNFRCPSCQNSHSDKELFLEHLELSRRYELVSNYVSYNDYVSLKDTKTNEIFNTTPLDFRNGIRFSFEQMKDKTMFSKLNLFYG